ncbi:MAG: hypothetical protein J5744_02070 [Oscillospiraceae bacterium]|nr:hypothetical protein [Oscillospiraceae bacterium]
MRICTNCGRILTEGEEICSECNSSLILETSGDPEADVSGAMPEPSEPSTGADLFDVPGAPPALPAEDETLTSTVSGEPCPITDTSEEDVTEGIPDFSFTGDTSIPASVPDDIIPEDSSLETDPEPDAGNDNFRIISVNVRSEEKLGNVNTWRIAAAILSLLALISLICAVFMIAVPLVQARQQDEAAKETAYMDFLRGEWLSETFIYSGKEFPSCEILKIDKNGRFESEIWTSPNDREKYDPETWTLTASQTGDLRLELDTSSLRVSYTDSDGNTMVYRRYILQLDTSSLVLREYYNEKLTDYYDVVFVRHDGKEQ